MWYFIVWYRQRPYASTRSRPQFTERLAFACSRFKRIATKRDGMRRIAYASKLGKLGLPHRARRTSTVCDKNASRRHLYRLEYPDTKANESDTRMTLTVRYIVVLLCALVSAPGYGVTDAHPDQTQRAADGVVTVRGRQLLRDGEPWIPHGFYQIAFEVAPANFTRADHPFWKAAYEHYSPEEYQQMREAGADSVRLQVSQVGADPRSFMHDAVWFGKAMDAVRAARAAGLSVIVCVQDETHVKGDTPIDLPDEATRRVWKQIASQFAGDRGVLFELLNEPRPAPNTRNWQRWAAAMTATLRTVRETGAKNVVIADGLAVGQVIDGAPVLDDPQVAYASHPYALHPAGQTRGAWDGKFGNFSRRAPVVITEWGSGGYHCDADTPESSVRFIQYLQEHAIGLEAGTWDWGPGGFGSARWDFPNGKFSSFEGLSCHQNGYGIGRVLQVWYQTGTPAELPR